jgi:molybdopterin-guanine dinucleotide biosynthesis protein A
MSADRDPTESETVGRDVTGVVLAGGRSSRFEDGDKATALVAGEPMLARVASTVSEVADDVVVNCREEQRDRFERALTGVRASIRYAIDDRPDEGPLVGLDTAVAIVETPVVVVASCDLPRLEPALLRDLLAVLEDGGRDGSDVERAAACEGVVPVDAGGYRNPACGVYETDALERAVASAVEDGDRSLRAVFDGLDVAGVPLESVSVPASTLVDVDTRAGLGAFENRES